MMRVTLLNVVLKIDQSCSFVSNRTIVTDSLDSFMLILCLLGKFEMYLFNMNYSCSYATICTTIYFNGMLMMFSIIFYVVFLMNTDVILF